MAIITLLKPSRALRRTRRGNNYLNLCTGEARTISRMDSPVERQPARNAYSVLATGLRHRRDRMPRLMCFFPGTWDNADPTAPWREFDKIVYEYQFNGVGVSDLPYQQYKLDELPDLESGSLLILRTGIRPVNYRYFKVLVRKSKYDDEEYNSAFRLDETALVYEEIPPGRIFVPINLMDDGPDGGLRVTTDPGRSDTIAAGTREIVWTVRNAAKPDNIGADYYNKPLPIVKTEFVERNSTGRSAAEAWSPPWVETTFQTNIFSDSYLNSTYAIKVDDAGRPERGSSADRYKYTVYAMDGTRMKPIVWDPEVVVTPPE